MKLIMVIFDADKEEIIHEILLSSGVEGFTMWGPVFGKGAHTDPRMGTQVWPGENQALITVVSEGTAVNLKNAIANHPGVKTGVKVFELETNTWL